MKSLIQSEKECYICRAMYNERNTRNLQCHHIFGGSRRKKSEADGLKVWLCREHHLGNEGVHIDPVVNIWIKRRAQKKYEETHTRDEFMERYGRNYL